MFSAMAREILADESTEYNDEGEYVPWGRLPEDTPRSWEVFQLYRDLGVNRNYAQVAKILHCTHSNVKKLGWEHQYMARALAWDDHVDKRYRKEYLTRQRTVARRHLEVSRYLRKRAMKALRKMPDAVLESNPAACLALLREAVRIEAAQLGTERQDVGPVDESIGDGGVNVYFEKLPLDKQIAAVEKGLSELYRERDKRKVLAHDAESTQSPDGAPVESPVG